MPGILIMTFSLHGIQIEITFLFFAFISFVISLKAPSNVLITIASSLLHEMGHLTAMLILNNKPDKVRFELIGINIVRKQGISISIRNEIWISLGGPLTNFIVVIFCCILLCIYNNDFLLTVACVNFLLMVFNILPINKLDGGTVLYYLLTQKYDLQFCSKILRITSITFISIIFVWGLYVFVVSRYNISLIIIAIFLIISLFSDNEY